MRIGRTGVKQEQKINLSQTKKIQNIVKNTFQNMVISISKNSLIY